MFNIGPGELAIILVAALIVLGPERLPGLARSLGKFMREFRRQTDDVKNLVEREFYKMDQQLNLDVPVPPATAPGVPVAPAIPAVTDPGHDEFGRLIAPPPVAVAVAVAEALPAAAAPEGEAHIPPPAAPLDPKPEGH